MKDIKKILVITLSNIGDVVLGLPVIGVLRNNFKEAHITVVVGPRAREVFDVDPRIDRMFVYDKLLPFWGKIKFLFDLRKERYDLIVDLRNSFFPFLLRHGVFNKSFPVPPPAGVIHKTDEHLLKLKTLGIKPDENISYPQDRPFYLLKEGSYPIWISQPDSDNARALLNKKGVLDEDGIICVSPGAKSHIKRWTESGFAKLCDSLIEEFGLKIVLVGDLDDKPICERILNRMKNYAVSVSGETNLRELAWCIKRSRLLVTNDSAPLHIAGSVGAPVVAIFGPTDQRKYGPWRGNGVVARRQLHCSPCESARCKYNLECMSALSAEDIIQLVREVLNETK